MNSSIRSFLQTDSRLATLRGDVSAFLLAATAAFLLTIGGGWYLAEQVTLPVDDILSSEVEMVGEATPAVDAAATLAASRSQETPRAPQTEWHFYIYSGAPLRDLERYEMHSAWTTDIRDEG